MITGLAHACFTVKDLDRTVKFYRDGLGLPVAFEFKDESKLPRGAYFRCGRRTFLEFFVKADVRPVPGDVSYRHICLEVDDIQKTVAEWRARGIEVSDPKLGLDQSWQAWLADPDGNAIELHQYTPESWQAPHL